MNNNSVKLQRWHGVDGGLFEGIDGVGVFFGVGETAVAEDAGYGLMLTPLSNRFAPQL